MTTQSNTARITETAPNLRERAERLRDAAGRFIRRSAPQFDPNPSARAEEQPPVGTVPAPINAHPDAYGLTLDTNGAGLRCPPGASVVVEPISPTGAGLVVLYRKGGGPEIWDLPHTFVPDAFIFDEGTAR